MISLSWKTTAAATKANSVLTAAAIKITVLLHLLDFSGAVLDTIGPFVEVPQLVQNCEPSGRT
jgi:hypothetical protein